MLEYLTVAFVAGVGSVRFYEYLNRRKTAELAKLREWYEELGESPDRAACAWTVMEEHKVDITYEEKRRSDPRWLLSAPHVAIRSSTPLKAITTFMRMKDKELA